MHSWLWQDSRPAVQRNAAFLNHQQVLDNTEWSSDVAHLFSVSLILFTSYVVMDNIKMDLQEVGGGCGDWMELAEDRDRWRHL